MLRHGGFDHNAQSLRIVTHLEQRYADFDGLNLTWETLEGLVKHNGPVVGAKNPISEAPFAVRKYSEKHDLELSGHAGIEAQIAAISDDIAYNNHDIDDGLRAGLFTIDDLLALPLVGDIFSQVMSSYPSLESRRLRHEVIRRLISEMVSDVVSETKKRITENNIESAKDVRSLNYPVAEFSPEMQKNHLALKKFLYAKMYRHSEVNRSMSKARRVVTDLFNLFYDEPDLLPEEWQGLCDKPGSETTARIICDYIAGMTDRFALEEHKTLFNLSEHNYR
jgi:dGTPase